MISLATVSTSITCLQVTRTLQPIRFDTLTRCASSGSLYYATSITETSRRQHRLHFVHSVETRQTGRRKASGHHGFVTLSLRNKQALVRDLLYCIRSVDSSKWHPLYFLSSSLHSPLHPSCRNNELCPSCAKECSHFQARPVASSFDIVDQKFTVA